MANKTDMVLTFLKLVFCEEIDKKTINNCIISFQLVIEKPKDWERTLLHFFLHFKKDFVRHGSGSLRRIDPDILITDLETKLFFSF